MQASTNDYWIGTITARSYPMFLPYRRTEEEPLAGAKPRTLVTIFSTLVNSGDPSWDPSTRTLSLDGGYRELADRFRLYSGGEARRTTDGTLEALTRFSYPSHDLTRVPMVEQADLSPRRTADRWLRFTPEYVDMLTDRPRPYPLTTFMLAGGVVPAYDLVALASMYGSTERRLLVPLPVLKILLSPGTDYASRRTLLRRAVSAANLSQDRWLFQLNKTSVSIAPAGVYVPLGPITLDLRSV